MQGDDNANATGTVEYRETGSQEWKPGFPLRRSPFRPHPAVKVMGGLDKWSPGMRKYALDHFGAELSRRVNLRATSWNGV